MTKQGEVMQQVAAFLETRVEAGLVDAGSVEIAGWSVFYTNRGWEQRVEVLADGSVWNPEEDDEKYSVEELIEFMSDDGEL